MALKFSGNSAALCVFVNLWLELIHTHIPMHPYLPSTRDIDHLVQVDGNLTRH